MKKFLIAVSALFLVLSLGAQQPQGRPEKKGFSKEDVENFKKSAQDRLQSEHIAYLTSELELTPEEAQAFWPVYNKAHKEQMENHEAYRKALKGLRQTLKDGKGEAEISAALEAYNKAKNDQRNVLADYQKEFVKILGIKKTAKLYVAEDSFRTRQINRLGGGNGPSPQPGVRPVGGNKGFQGKSGQKYDGRQPKEKPVQMPEDI